MSPCEPDSWVWKAVAGAWAVLEFWLGRTSRVRAGSVLEAILNGLERVALVLIVGFLMCMLGIFHKPEKEKDEH